VSVAFKARPVAIHLSRVAVDDGIARVTDPDASTMYVFCGRR
jgi:hypothetical protein